MRPYLRAVPNRPSRPTGRVRRSAPAWNRLLMFCGTGVIGIVIVVIAGFKIWSEWPKAPARAATCRDVQSAMIDLSDKVDSATRQRIVARLDRLPIESCMGTRVLVSQFRPNADEPVHELFNRIDPGKSSELPFETKKIVDQKRETEFAAPLRAQLDRAVVPEERSQTLLIQGLSLYTRMPAFRGDDPAVSKTVVIVSDMLNFSKGCSMYPAERTRPATHWVNVRERCRQLVAEHPLRLKSADVEILLIKRGRGKNGAELQPPELKEFWEDVLKSAGARSVTWMPM